MKKGKIIIVCAFIFVVCSNILMYKMGERAGRLDELLKYERVFIGKDIDYKITEEVAHNELDFLKPSCQDDDAINQLSEFMKVNNLVIVPGDYTVQQLNNFQEFVFNFRFKSK